MIHRSLPIDVNTPLNKKKIRRGKLQIKMRKERNLGQRDGISSSMEFSILFLSSIDVTFLHKSVLSLSFTDNCWLKIRLSRTLWTHKIGSSLRLVTCELDLYPFWMLPQYHYKTPQRYWIGLIRKIGCFWATGQGKRFCQPYINQM